MYLKPSFQTQCVCFRAEDISHNKVQDQHPSGSRYQTLREESSKGCYTAEEENRETEAVERTSRSARVIEYKVQNCRISTWPADFQVLCLP